jgi:hypothetical protein
VTSLFIVIASEHFVYFIRSAVFRASEAIPFRVRAGVEVFAVDSRDCHGLPRSRPSILKKI